MSGSEFLNRQSSKGYYYLTMPVDNLPDQLKSDIGDFSPFTIPWRSICMLFAHPLVRLMVTGEANLWVSKSPTTMTMHYDLLHNFYCQIHGKKKFVLFPPSDAKHLYLFPRLHPSSRMSQIDPNQLDKFPGSLFPKSN